ncbi:MAG: hypothetical protein JSV92_04870 [archaeon]|nr:MAG: hypothetical protein JSV92_04870 [archaeon]
MTTETIPTDKSDEMKPKGEVPVSDGAYSSETERGYKSDLKKADPEKLRIPYPREKFVLLDFENGRWYNLSMAIEDCIGIGRDEAKRDAGFVLDIFGYSDRVIDNVLDPEDRQLFYILEEVGMLTTEREVTTLYDGREWRTHYWVIVKDKIMEYARLHLEKIEPPKINPLNENKPDSRNLGDFGWASFKILHKGQATTYEEFFEKYDVKRVAKGKET